MFLDAIDDNDWGPDEAHDLLSRERGQHSPRNSVLGVRGAGGDGSYTDDGDGGDRVQVRCVYRAGVF